MPRYFDDDLPRVNADKIKPMVKMWGGESKMRKDECIACISAGLADPQKVESAIGRLEPWERNALSLIKRMGGIIQNSTLGVGLLASGLHPRRTYGFRDDFIDPLFRRGLILATGGYGPDSISNAEKITYLKVALPMVWLGSSICPSNHQKQYAWYLYNHQRPFVQFGRWFR